MPATLIHDVATAAVPVERLYQILKLRSEVFVVEQACVYLDLDGRDLEPSARILWVEDEAGAVAATARLLDDGDARRIGRIATRPSHRGRGLARSLLDHAVARSAGPWVLDAQSHLAPWYAEAGFVVSGAEYIEDGIPHVPMRRESDGR